MGSKSPMKECSRCNRRLHKIHDFAARKGQGDGRQPWCRDCMVEYWSHTPSNEKMAVYERTKRMNRDERQFGIPAWQVAQYRASPCDICGAEPPSHIDHCHTTGEVRGSLCMHCNTALGKFQDNPTLLQRAIDYLQGAHRIDGDAPATPDVGAQPTASTPRQPQNV